MLVSQVLLKQVPRHRVLLTQAVQVQAALLLVLVEALGCFGP